MMSIALLVLLACIFFMLIGIFTSKSLAEKLMSLCCVTNYIIVLICMLSILDGRDSFVDIAYIFALFGFIINLAATKLNRSESHD